MEKLLVKWTPDSNEKDDKYKMMKTDSARIWHVQQNPGDHNWD